LAFLFVSVNGDVLLSKWALCHLGFLKSQNFIVADGRQRAEVHQHAIFHQNWSNSFEIIIFNFP